MAQWNMFAGWAGMFFGLISGSVIGLFFHQADFAGGYGAFRRRLLRLGHIAFFGLGLINLAVAGHCGRLNFSPTARRRALALINLGNIGLPPLLLAATWQPALLYLMPAPVLCVFAALALTAAAAWRIQSPQTL